MALSHWKQTNFTPLEAAEASAVLGLGTDLCAVARLADADDDVLAAVLRPEELTRCRDHPYPARALAAHVAAKEAVIKALAAAPGHGMFWHDIEIATHGRRTPTVTLHGRLADLALGLGAMAVHLSWAHCRAYATACAIVSGAAPAAQPDVLPDDGAGGPATGGR